MGLLAKNQIIAALPQLSPADLAEVLTAAKLTASLGGPPPAPDLQSDWVMSGIISLLVKEGLIQERGARWDITKRQAYKQYLSKLPALMCFLVQLQEKSHLMGSRYQPRIAFLCAGALASLLKGQNIFSVSTMLSQIDKIPEALEKDFPGYLAASMFGFIVMSAG